MVVVKILATSTSNLFKMATHFLEPVHEYIDTIKECLILAGETVSADRDASDILWVPYVNNYSFGYQSKKIVYVWHGGTSFTNSLLDKQFIHSTGIINVVVKYDHEFQFIKNLPNINCLKFLGKHTGISSTTSGTKSIKYAHFQHSFYSDAASTAAFLAIPDRYKSDIKIFGTDSPEGYAKDINTLPSVKFLLFLKTGGYVCNSIKKALIFGIPVIMLQELYEKEYACVYPRDLFILCKTFEEGLRYSETLSSEQYALFSNYVRSWSDLYIRRYTAIEISDIKNFSNRIQYDLNTLGLPFDFSATVEIQDPLSMQSIRESMMREVVKNQNNHDIFNYLRSLLIANEIVSDDWIKTTLALKLARVGRYDQASETLAAAENYISVGFLNTHAQVKLLEGDIASAIKLLKKSILLQPSAWAYYFLIEAQVKEGQYDEALVNFKELHKGFSDFNMLTHLKALIKNSKDSYE